MSYKDDKLLYQVANYARAYHDLYGAWPRLVMVPYGKWKEEGKFSSVNIPDLPESISILDEIPRTDFEFSRCSFTRISVEPIPEKEEVL